MRELESVSPRIRALIVTADRFEDMEAIFPYCRLLEEGVEVVIAAPAKGQITGERGYKLEAQKAIEYVNPYDYDILILPGGGRAGAPATVRDIPQAQEIARAFFAANKPVAAICHGPYTLISAGLMKGRRATCYWGDGVPEEIMLAGGNYVDEEVVVDGNLITSRSPKDLPAFMRELMNKVREVADNRVLVRAA